jgi:hypothetical protein
VNLVARIISYVFHPLLMGSYLFAVMAFLLPAALYPINNSSQFLFVGVFFMMSFVLPVLMLSMMKAFGSIRSLTMESRRERVFPFFMILVLYGTFTYMFTYQGKIVPDHNLFKFVLIIDALVLASLLITFFYKVSVHAIGILGYDWCGGAGRCSNVSQASVERPYTQAGTGWRIGWAVDRFFRSCPSVLKFTI